MSWEMLRMNGKIENNDNQPNIIVTAVRSQSEIQKQLNGLKYDL